MTLVEKIDQQVRALPPEKQNEVLDFVNFLSQKLEKTPKPAKPRSLRQHPAYGSWKERKIDSLGYEQTLRSEWDSRS